jgi:putative transferase (TIGR04331 family)
MSSKNFFLATTALQEYWNKSQPILFLGEWCKLYRDRKELESLQYETLPYHWDDRKKLYKDFYYLESLSERLLVCLSDALNEIHDLKYSLRCWKIIVGPWLSLYFLPLLFDRYLSIKSAIETGYKLNTLIPDDRNFIPPKEISSIFPHIYEDYYNLILYSDLIKLSGKIPYKIQNGNIIEKRHLFDKTLNTQSLNLKNSILNILNKILRPFSRNNNILIKNLPLSSLIKHYAISIFLGQIPYSPDFTIRTTCNNPEIKKRHSLLNGFIARNEFEIYLKEILVKHLPLSYLENFSSIREKVLIEFNRKIDMIVSGFGSLCMNDSYKILVAEQILNGTNLIIVQHGGGYGTFKYLVNEKHELNISDRFLSWAPGVVKSEKIIPFFYTKTSVKKIKQYKAKGKLLIIGSSVPRYAFNILIHISSQFLIYIEEQIRFIKALNPDVQSFGCFRKYFDDYDWSIENRIRDRSLHKNFQFENVNNVSFENSLFQSRLVVATYHSTTNYEALCYGIPVIWFWNPEYDELSDKALPHFRELVDAKILHFSPESAAEHANYIFDNPMKWWMQEDVKLAVQRFSKKFIRTTPNITGAFAKEIKKLQNEYRQNTDR